MHETETYAKTLWLPDDIIEIRPLQPWQGQRVFTLAKNIGEHLSRMGEENERGAGIYAGVMPRVNYTDGDAEHCASGRVLWADFDHCADGVALEAVSAIGLPMPSMAVNSGHGTHLFWVLNQVHTKDDIVSAVGNLITFFLEKKETRNYIDKSAKDAARILRLPGFVNHKPPAAKATIVYSDPSITYPLSVFAAFSVAPPVGVALPQISHIPTTSGNDTTRAAAYLKTIEGSQPGGRTNTAFRAACVLVNDIGVSDMDALVMLREWDMAANHPPICQDYGPDELSKIINNAKKYHKKPAGCLPSREPAQYDIGAQCDLSGIISQGADEREIKKLDEKYYDVPGLIGETYQYIMESANKAQENLALAGAIVLQAILCARKLTDNFGTRPNIYVCGICASGDGKDCARQVIKRVLMEANLSQLSAEGVASGTGLMTALIAQPALLFQFDEYGRLLKSAARDKQGTRLYEITSNLLKLYSSSNGVYETDRYADVNRGGKRIIYPHAITYGTSVEESFYEGLSAESITDGFLARTIVFPGSGKANTKLSLPEQTPIPESIVNAAKFWGEFKPLKNPFCVDLENSAHNVPVMDSAKKRYQEFIEYEFNEREKMGENPIRILWTRAVQNAMKLSMIYAASRAPESPVIDSESAGWACGLVEHLTHNLIDMADKGIAHNPFHAHVLKLQKFLIRSKGRADRSKISKHMKITPRLLDEVINCAQEMGLIAAATVSTSGRPKTEYRYIGN